MKTECPHCHTIFKVSQQQLELADGMVRCGVCQQVFNALVQPDLFNENEIRSGDETADDLTGETSEAIQTDIQTGTPKRIQQHTNTGSADRQHKDSILFDDSETAQVVPDELRYSDHRRGIFSTLMWTLASLLLTATLLLQFAWYQREHLIHQPWLQTYIAQTCQHIDCSLLQLRDPQKIELSKRNVYTHPTENNALMVSLTLVNKAPYAQAFPDIQIEFSDVVGTVIAARRLRPQEYLNAGADKLQPLLPDKPVTLALEIVDPGKQALTYEFRFL